jgi:hypothetical protein
MSVLQPLVIASIGLALLYLAVLTTAVVVLALRVGERDDDPMDDRQAFSASRLAIPVSIVVPVAAGAGWRDVAATVEALLGLNYPTFEVIVVADDLPAGAWDPTKALWELEAREIFFRVWLDTAPIRMMYRSARDPRLIVVHKTPGSFADALNCGVNLAKFRYVSAVEPGIAFDADALLRAMTAPLRDPANVAGATSHVEIRGGAFQRLRSIRSLMKSRVLWRHLEGVLGPRDAVVVWRRDAIEQAGGFSTTATDPQLDMMVRLQNPHTVSGASLPGRIVRTAEVFGHRRKRSVVEEIRETLRRQRAALEAVSTLRGASSAIRPMLTYFFVSEVLTACAQMWMIVASAVAAAAGWLPWTDAAWAVVLIAAGHGVVSAAALLVRGAVSHAPAAAQGRAAA